MRQSCARPSLLGSRAPRWRPRSATSSRGPGSVSRGRARACPPPRAMNWVTDALFKSKEQKALEAFAESDAGRRAAAHAASSGGGFDEILAFGRKEVVDLHTPGGGHLIDTSTRVLVATLINRVVDIPILNEATEQVLAVKAVDLIADFLESELERAGIAAFFEDVRGMTDAELDAWVGTVGRRVNDAVNLPMLNEDQEEIVIELVLKLVAEKFVRGEEKLKLPFGLKLPFT